MLDIKFIRENLAAVKANLNNRNVTADVEKLLELDEKRREFIQKVDVLRAERNKGSKGKPTPEEIARMRSVGDEIKQIESQKETVDKEYSDLLKKIPNMTHPDSPIGGEDAFKVLYTNREPQQFSFTPKDHEALLTDLDLIDFERGAKVTESKAYFLKNEMVELNQALIQYGLSILKKHGFILVETPDLAKNEILDGIGFNPKGEAEDQIYVIENTDLSLIATAEITLGGYHANEVLDLSKGPIKYAAISHCFRKEAGAYGRTSKGLYRVHQFTKLEMFVFSKPEESETLHQELLDIEKEIMDGLDLPYRVIDIPTGDLGGPAYRKFDIEGWMTMKAEGDKQGGYGEVTSTSNCTDYQARRLNIRYRKAEGVNEYVHTLNGTAIVTSRFPVAIVENYQQEDGSILIPEVLRKYMGKDSISPKK